MKESQGILKETAKMKRWSLCYKLVMMNKIRWKRKAKCLVTQADKLKSSFRTTVMVMLKYL